MWDLVVKAAQSPALHWTVVAGAVAALIYKVLSASDGPLMGDVYKDDLDN
jgi:hypothetical protein